MLTRPVTLYWYRADQSCFVVPTSCWISCKQEPLPFLKSLVWLDQAPTGNWTHRTTWSVLSPPYCRLLRLFVCGISLTSGQLINKLFPDCTRYCFLQVVLRLLHSYFSIISHVHSQNILSTENLITLKISGFSTTFSLVSHIKTLSNPHQWTVWTWTVKYVNKSTLTYNLPSILPLICHRHSFVF